MGGVEVWERLVEQGGHEGVRVWGSGGRDREGSVAYIASIQEGMGIIMSLNRPLYSSD